jgi:hypothetical protein
MRCAIDMMESFRAKIISSARLRFLLVASGSFGSLASMASAAAFAQSSTVASGPKVSYDFSSYPGVIIEPAFDVKALWNFQRDATTVDPEVQDNLQAETEFSTEIKTATGLSLNCSIGYSGIGVEQTHVFKALMAINLPLLE